mgnify:CR=1 FL=1
MVVIKRENEKVVEENVENRENRENHEKGAEVEEQSVERRIVANRAEEIEPVAEINILIMYNG